MTRSPARALTAALALVLATAIAVPSLAAAATLNGTFALTAGKYNKKKRTATGTYFKMILAHGSVKKGPYFINPNSKAGNFTLLRPGIDGGLQTGVFQDPPSPAFDSRGFALSNRIMKPTLFADVAFSLSTAATDAQSGKAVGPPVIKSKGRKLTGDLRGFTAMWNNTYFNQGSPKPSGKYTGHTRPVAGTYNSKTKRFVLTWTSQIVGGPFDGLTGYWHLQGKFRPRS
jgi:hypothetical protein